MLDEIHQPSTQSLVERMSHELGARAVLVLHENGQVLHRYGWISENEYPTMAALISAMIATGNSLGKLGEHFPHSPSRLSCDSDAMGLYMVGVNPGLWLAVLYEQPMNPGQFRMKVRRYASLLAKIGVSQPMQWETESPSSTRDKVAPKSTGGSVTMEIITEKNSSLFANITDEEIDEIFENARS